MIKIQVDTGKKIGSISPMIYGQMIEHAYWSVHLGLCAQMLDNGGFELDRERRHYTVAQGWRLYSTHHENEYTALVTNEAPYNGQTCQKLTVKKFAGGCVRLTQHYLSVEKGRRYKGFILLRGTCDAVGIALLSVTKRVIAQTPVTLGADWKKVEFTLESDETDFAASFAVEMRGVGTLFADQAFLYPEESYGGVRKDMAELYKALCPPFFRWPGGSYLIWHHWKESIGPLEDRPYNDGRNLRDSNFGVYHDGEWDSNAFGTDEFVAFCRDCGAEPMINVNIKDGLQNTLDWIEYCNGGTDTVWGAERARNGHPEPYNVKYWVIDNEPLVQTSEKGYCKETFPIDTAVYARVMKRKDPSITVMVMGDHDLYNYCFTEPVFSETMVEATRDTLDHLCVHIYYDQTFTGPLQGMPYQMGQAFTRLKKTIGKHCPDREVKVFLSEWNPESNTNVDGNMGQALEAAQMFHVMARASAAGEMDFATPCQLCVNVDRYRGFWLRSAMVQINNHQAWTNPMYHVYRMYSRLRLPNLLRTEVDEIKRPSPAFDGWEFPAFDVMAEGSEDGKKLNIKAVNNTDDQSFDFFFSLKDFPEIAKITAHEVSAESILDLNTQFTPDHIREKTYEIKADGKGFSHSVARNTVVLFEIEAK